MIEPRDALRRVLARHDLSRAEMEGLIGRLMDGDVSEALQAALLIALAMKGEAVDEIAGAAAAMRERAVRIPHRLDGVVDTCGTGGDGKGSFNVSTAAALVAAAGGARVAKHGNRSVSSRSGSADVLAALGVPLELAPEACGRALAEIGIAFLFAPKLHPAIGAVMPVRRALGVRTLFNVLGPLTNPAGARRQLLGVYHRDLVAPLAAVLRELGSEHALVVHGDDGMDEITLTDATFVAELRDGTIERYELTPEDFGLEPVAPELLAGGEPEENAELLRGVLAGDESSPRARALLEITAMNAGAALYVGGVADDLATGHARARAAIHDGRAARKLDQLRTFTDA